MSQMNINLETHIRKSIIDQEIDYLKRKEDVLEIRSNYLKEMQMLQTLRRKMFLECIDDKDEESLETLSKKLQKVQNIIQENLIDQVEMLKERVGEDIYCGSTGDLKNNFFRFEDYMDKMKIKT
ncbi:uncharacterized protein LOC129221304 [Uloborus diversus]|nr:uncharacterized protein LOC129221304 [Uloborus diversus]